MKFAVFVILIISAIIIGTDGGKIVDGEKRVGVDYTKEKQCAVCKWMSWQAEQLILENETLAEINQALASSCLLFSELGGGYQQMCYDLFSQSSNAIIQQLLNHVTPDQVCHKLSICDDSMTEQLVYQGSTFSCAVCEIAAETLKKFVDMNVDLLNAEQSLISICKESPNPWVVVSCVYFVQNFALNLLGELHAGRNAATACKDLHFC